MFSCLRLGWLISSCHSMVPEWAFLRGTPWLEMRRSFVPVFLYHSQFLPASSHTFPLPCLCSSAIGVPMDAGSILPGIPAQKGLQASLLPMLSQLYVHLMAASSHPLLPCSLSILSVLFLHHVSHLLPLPLPHDTAVPSLCYCPGRSVSHHQPIAPLASFSFGKPKYSF